MPLLDVRPDHLEWVKKILAEHVPQTDVWAFGSRAKWLAKDTSDLDLCVDAKQALSFVQIGLLKEAFEDSDLPYKVDVVDWATTSESFRKIIERDRVAVQRAGEGGIRADVPEHSLESICLLVVDCPHATPKWTDSGVVVLRNQNIKGGRLDLSTPSFTDEAHYEGRTKRAVPKAGDIVITREAPMGDVCLIPEGLRCCLGQRQVLLRPDPKKVDARFLLFALQSPYIQFQIGWNEGTGSTVSNLRIPVLEALKIPTPPMSLQIEIATTLGALDDRITLLRETNATLEAIAQALFKSWFVDFDPVRAKQEGRAPEGMDEATARLFPDSFEESELGLVPGGWRVGPIGESISVVDFVANGSFASLKENVTLQNTPSYALYLRTTDFNSGYSGDFRYVDRSAYEFLSKSSLDGTEVVISNVGDVGTVFRPPTWLGLPMTLGSNAVALKGRGHSAFMYLYFSGAKGQHDIQSIVTGSAQLKFNKTNFRSLLIALPEAAVLQHFESIAGALLSTIDINLATAQTLATLRDTLLPRLISGQLRLPEAQAAAEEALA